MSWLGPRSVDGGIDAVPLPVATGALSLCGKHAIGPDHAAAMERANATTVVCLVEAHELDERYPAYLAWLHERRGHEVVWLPVHDLHAPPLARALPFLADLVERIGRGERLLMHCGAGLGRAGTMAACLLIELGLPRDDALALVAASRPMAGPEVGSQRDLVEQVAARQRAS
jgi:protein-tyrosine phosphatase